MKGTIKSAGGSAEFSTTGKGAKTHNVTPEPRNDEHKAAVKFLHALNTLTFSPRVVAVAFSLAPPVLQARLMECFRFWCDILEAEYDRGFHKDDDHLEVQVMAKRLNDGMVKYEE
jgi:hypothetical protein